MSIDTLPTADWKRVHRLVREFERGLAGDSTTTLDSALREAGPLRPIVLPELLHAECEHRLRHGITVNLTEYRQKFPELPDSTWDELNQVVSRETTLDRVGQYRLVRLLGRGGMGIVYEAIDDNLRRRVALKMLAAPHDAEHVCRLRREAEALARVSSPSIVQVYDVGEIDGRVFLVQELVTGGTLADRLREGPLEPGDAAEIVHLLAAAVELAHSAEVIHRDIKPANVLLSRGGEPKLTDFGLARLGDVTLTATDAIVGTPAYMAPEQATGGGVGPAADVYSLGAVLYDCLTGRPPHRGATPLETLDQVRRQDPVAPTQLRPGLPRDLETICLAALAKEPTRRYRSALALSEDLGRWMRGQPIHARPVGALERAAMWARRNPVVATLTGALVTLLTTVAIAAVLTARHQTQLRQEADAIAAKERDRRVALRESLDNATSTAIKDLVHSGRSATEYREFFDKIVAAYDQLAADEADDPRSRREHVLAMSRLAPIFVSLRRDDRAAQTFDRATRLMDELLPQDATLLPSAATLYHDLANWHHARHQHDAAIRAGERSAELHDREATPRSASRAALSRQIAILSTIRLGRPDEARARLREAERRLQESPVGSSPEEIAEAARAWNNFANSASLLNATADAERLIRRAGELIRPLAANPATRRVVIDALATITHNLGEVELRARRFAEAEALLREAAQHYREHLHRSPARPTVRLQFARCLNARGTNLRKLDLEREGLIVLREACMIFEGLIDDDPGDANVTYFAADAYTALDIALRAGKQFDESRQANDRVTQLYQKTLDLVPGRRGCREGIGGSMVNRAALECDILGPAAALPWLAKAEPILVEATQVEDTPRSHIYLRNLYMKRARMQHLLRDHAAALISFDTALACNTIAEEANAIRAERALTLLGIPSRVPEAIHEVRQFRDDSRPATRFEVARVLAAATNRRAVPVADRPALADESAAILARLIEEGFFRSAERRNDFAGTGHWRNVRERPELKAALGK